MTDHILAVLFLLCVFYTASKVVGWAVDIFVAKFVATDKKIQSAVSGLISLTSLRWGGIEADKEYTVTTKGYVVIVKKNTKKDK
ncbi:hypothetical protein [Klebsiella grimontii]|uniref:hypothetical protein n=1 Tax=Klebsiella grimontii TaxID=2058152 RepID=UPI0012B8FADF|nr:hypothetical protein [Klebsiella grimontii]